MSYAQPPDYGLDCPCIGPTTCLGQYKHGCQTAYMLPIVATATGNYTLRYWFAGKWFASTIEVVSGEPVTVPGSALPDLQPAVTFILNDSDGERVTFGTDPAYNTFTLKFYH